MWRSSFAAHHRRQRQRDERRNDDRDRQRDRELAEQPADDVAHEQQRNQHRDQRNRQRKIVKPICSEPLSAASSGDSPSSMIAGDVFDHHDGVVHHEAGGDRERHQREVVQAVAEQIHHAERADDRQRHGDAGNDRGRNVAQEQEDHHHDQRDRQHQLELHVLHRGADGGGAVGENRDLDRGRAATPAVAAADVLMRSTTAMMFAPGWR